MDETISRWILDFILRKPLSDEMINRIIPILPPSIWDLRIQKSVLLRSLQSEISDGCISEEILEVLEIIEELDHREGAAVLDSMKEAYCAVAVESTVKFLLGRDRRDDKYLDAVKRIWRGKIRQLENSGAGLFSDRLCKWRDDIENAVQDTRVCKEIMAKNTRNEALMLLQAYLTETWAIMGPSFLELVAETMKPVETASSHDVAAESVVPDENKEMQKANVVRRRKHVGGPSRRSRRGVRIADTEEVRGQSPGTKYDSLLTPEVDKVQEALKNSSLELQALVKDPLPEALRLAETISSSINVSHEPLTKNQGTVDEDAPNTPTYKNLDVDQNNEDALANQCTTVQNNVPRPNIMARNSTARTYEWDDSIDALPEDPPSGANIHLPSPKRRAVSPLKKYETTKISRRRKIKKWSLLEEDTLRTGVQRFGAGNWALILNSYRDIFEERNQVDLKDKWRNMTK